MKIFISKLYDNIRIWKPDVLLYNSASQEFDTTYEVNVNVNHEGLCKYGPPAIFESTCKVILNMYLQQRKIYFCHFKER